MNNEDMVLKYMIDNKGIASMEAFNKLGVTRLSAPIFNLRKKYIINDIWLESVNRYGNKVRFKKYIYSGKISEF